MVEKKEVVVNSDIVMDAGDMEFLKALFGSIRSGEKTDEQALVELATYVEKVGVGA
jgi:hypothetical protein